MSTVSHIPTPLAGEPVKVIEKVIKEVDCPNPECDHKLNITNINEGTKIKCENCKNVTWVPAYKPKWWQRTKGFIWTIVISFILGICSSIVATIIYESYKNSKQQNTEQPKTTTQQKTINDK